MNNGLYFDEKQYLEYVKGTIESNIQAVKKMKPFRRPPGVYPVLTRLLSDTETRLVNLGSTIGDE